MGHGKFKYSDLKSKSVDIEKAKREFGCFPASHYDFYSENTIDKR